MKSIEDIKRDNRAGYRVPDGYFSELNQRVVDQAASQSQRAKGLPAVRSMLSFVGGFAVMVVMAMTGYYFTGYSAINNQTEQDNMMFVSLYDIEVDEIVSAEDSQNESTEIQNKALLADAAYDYLTTYGYDITYLSGVE